MNVRSLDAWTAATSAGDRGQRGVARVDRVGGRDDAALALLAEDDGEAGDRGARTP